MPNLIVDIGADAVEAAVRAALKDYFAGEIAKGTIDRLKAAYIEEGAADAVAFGVHKMFGEKK